MWDSIVLGGLHWQYGMVGFGGELSKEQADAIHAYVIERAHFALDREAGGLQRIQIVKPVQRAAVIDFGERGSCARAWRPKKAGTLRHRPLIAISRYRQRFRL